MTDYDDPFVISFINLKGGVGKTALSVNFAHHCARHGLRTLLVDLDPQTNATFACMSVDEWQEHAKKHGTVADLLGLRRHTKATGKIKDASEVIAKNVRANLDLIPSHLDLFTVDLDLGSETARETKLKRAVKPMLGHYDIVVCDCPPNLTIPTQNAIAMSSHYLVPVSPDYLSIIGIALLKERVEQLSGDLENPIENAGIVLSRVGRPSTYRTQTKNTLREKFGEDVFTTEINERSAVSEATLTACSIFEMPDTVAASEFMYFSTELLGRLGVE